jgi:hypothetical protein
MDATRSLLLAPPLVLAGVALLLGVGTPPVRGGPKPEICWQVDDVRPGMKGQGRTVMKGTRIETFEAEVLGVLKNSSPGRDMVLCRLSGLNLAHTGVIAGMSGSPIYIDGKLLGAVAYAWPYGKEPIAGVTPFCQMRSCAEPFEHRSPDEETKPRRLGLRTPLTIGGTPFDMVTVAGDCAAPEPPAGDGLWMVPLRTPVAATGFSEHSLALLRDHFRGTGLVPVQGGGALTRIADEEKDIPLQPGSPLAVALVLGDFDMSGIGTVTHVEGGRVYGWGHPFMGLGACDIPLMTGYIHTIYPRQSVSFKMGSPLKTVGAINADTSTGIAGWLERKPEMLPVRTTLVRESDTAGRTFNVQVVRQRSLLAPLVFTVLTNAVDMEGDLPEEMTAELKARIEVEGHEPVVLHDTFSGGGCSGGRAPQALYNPVAGVVGLLTYNSYQPVRINRIECETRVRPGRCTAEIEAVELDSDRYAPGETVRATAFLRPYKGAPQRVLVTLQLPADLPEGAYRATVCDDLSAARAELHDNPTLNDPRSLEQLFAALNVQTSARRTNLALRVPTRAAGVALDGKALPNLPPSMVQVLGDTRRTGAERMATALVARRGTDWVVLGSESVSFTVTRNKRVLPHD